jgi:hypothetical protein
MVGAMANNIKNLLSSDDLGMFPHKTPALPRPGLKRLGLWELPLLCSHFAPEESLADGHYSRCQNKARGSDPAVE